MNDVNINILLQLPYPDIIKLCQTDRRFYNLCQENYLWNQLMDRDFRTLTTNKDKNTYILLYHFFNQHTLDFLKNYININVIYDLQNLYQIVFDAYVKVIKFYKKYEMDIINYKEFLNYIGDLSDGIRDILKPDWYVGGLNLDISNDWNRFVAKNHIL